MNKTNNCDFFVNNCKLQDKNVQKVENKNVQLS